jgi:hypothetical protein
MPTKSTNGRRRKIDRLSDEYDLGDIGAELAQKWVSQNTDHTLKDLRDIINRRVLNTIMQRSGVEPAPGEIEYTYDNLFYDEKGTTADREEILSRLESHGIDPDSITAEFINSPQTIHDYLREVRDVDRVRNKNRGDDKEKVLDQIQKFSGRQKKIVNEVIEMLQKQGDITEGDYNISVDIYVENTSTGEERTIEEILEN